MTSRVIPVAPFVLTVFGATGDLARRKLLPALFHRDFDGQLPEAATILGIPQGTLMSRLGRARAALRVATGNSAEPHLRTVK